MEKDTYIHYGSSKMGDCFWRYSCNYSLCGKKFNRSQDGRTKHPQLAFSLTKTTCPDCLKILLEKNTKLNNNLNEQLKNNICLST